MNSGLESARCHVSVSTTVTAAARDDEVSLLIQSARGGSVSSLGTLLEMFRADLTQRAKSDLHVEMYRRMSMSDLVQDTMLTACRKFHEFRGHSPGELEAWLIRIFRSRLIDGIRRHQVAESRRLRKDHRPDVLSEIMDDGISASGLMILEEQSLRLMSALQQLSAEAQQLIQMRYVENETFEAIALKLNLPLTTVWRRFRETTEALHRYLKQ